MSGLAAAARLIGRLNGIFLLICKYLVIGLVAAIAAIVCAGVFWRYVLGDALSWYEEVSKFLMVWMTFLGAPLVFRHGGHVAVEILPNLLPERPRAGLHVLVHLIVMSLCAVLTHQSWLLALNARMQVALTVGDLSLFWIYLAIPVGCALMFFVTLQLLLEAVLHLLAPGQAPAAAPLPPDRVLASE